MSCICLDATWSTTSRHRAQKPSSSKAAPSRQCTYKEGIGRVDAQVDELVEVPRCDIGEIPAVRICAGLWSI